MFTATPFRTSRTWKQPRCPSTDEKKMRYIYTKEYYSAIKRNTLESVLVRWMSLELVIGSEVRKRTNTIHRCICMETRKIIPVNLFVGKEMETQT